MGTSGSRDCQWAPIHEDALTISAGSLFQNGTTRMVKTNWRRRVQHLCWWNVQAWQRSHFRVGFAKVDTMGNPRRPWVTLNMSIRSPLIARCMRLTKRSCLRSASYGKCRSTFTNFRASSCTFSSASASRDSMGWVV